MWQTKFNHQIIAKLPVGQMLAQFFGGDTKHQSWRKEQLRVTRGALVNPTVAVTLHEIDLHHMDCFRDYTARKYSAKTQKWDWNILARKPKLSKTAQESEQQRKNVSNYSSTSLHNDHVASEETDKIEAMTKLACPRCKTPDTAERSSVISLGVMPINTSASRVCKKRSPSDIPSIMPIQVCKTKQCVEPARSTRWCKNP